MFELIGQATPEAWSGIIIAVSTLISALSGIIVYVIHNPKIDAVARLAGTSADKVIENKQDVTTLAKVTYGMLPEEAQKITDAQNVKLEELTKKLNETTAEITSLKSNLNSKVKT